MGGITHLTTYMSIVFLLLVWSVSVENRIIQLGFFVLGGLRLESSMLYFKMRGDKNSILGLFGCFL